MVSKASLIIEYNGETCAVLLDGVNLDLLVNAVACLGNTGTLKAVKLDKSFSWESLESLVTKKEQTNDTES